MKPAPLKSSFLLSRLFLPCVAGFFIVLVTLMLLTILYLPAAAERRQSERTSKVLNTQDLEEVKQILLKQINRDRAAYHLPPVEYDKLAAEVGESHCQEMLEGGYLSHWNREGLKPYHRYSLAGGRDYVAENAFTYEINPPVEITKDLLIKRALFAQRQFMAEKAPHDGHKKNILDPHHTAVGIGLAYSGSGFRLTQEFINRYVAMKDLPSKAGLSSPLWVEGKPLNGVTFENIALFYEPFPKPMSPRELKNTSSYSLPSARRNLFRKLSENRYYSDGSQGEVEVAEDGSFKAPLTFWKGPGVYTVVVWVKPDGGQSFTATSISLFVR